MQAFVMQSNLTHLRERKKSMKKNYSQLVKGILFGVVTLSLLGMLLIPSLQGVQQNTSANENGRAEYLARLGKGIEGVGFARSGEEVQSKIAMMDSYITERAGLRLSPLVSDKLASLEQATLSGNQSLISFDKLVETITDVALQRNSELTDLELDQVITSAQGFNSPDMPAKGNNSVTPLIALRPGNYVQMEKTEAIQELKSLQSVKAQLIAKDYIRNFITQEVRTSLVNLATASPDKFGQTWDLTNNRPAKGLTPSQAYLLTYSLVSGDLLTDDKAGLQKRMDSLYQIQAKIHGSYPNPSSYIAYGDNGYLYSSPISIFFNEKVQIELLEKLAK